LKWLGMLSLQIEYKLYVYTKIKEWSSKETNITTAENLPIEAMIVDFDLRVSFKIIRQQKAWRRNVH